MLGELAMNGIILAAGMGTRLRPITLTTPKSLIKVGDKPIIERQIEFLHEIGVKDIYIVTGYLNECFQYLKGKYGVHLVNNDKYDIYNNIYSMYLVKEHLPDSYVIDADNYLTRNFLIPNPTTSLYFSAKKEYKNEWEIKYDLDHHIYDIQEKEAGNDFILCGVSYWSKEDGKFLAEKVDEAIQNGDFHTLYWDNIVKDNISNINVKLFPIEEYDTFEIDSINDLNKLRREVEARSSKIY